VLIRWWKRANNKVIAREVKQHEGILSCDKEQVLLKFRYLAVFKSDERVGLRREEALKDSRQSENQKRTKTKNKNNT
jgi:hypothetical protein